MIKNRFEWYIGIFIFYFLLINYATFIGKILIFGPGPKDNCRKRVI